VLVGIEFRARLRVELHDAVALQRGGQLAQRGVHAFQHLLRGRGLDGDGGLQAVLHGQQALGKRLDGVLAGLGHFLVRPAADVLGLGLGAQVGVGHFRVLGLEFGQALLGRGVQVRGGGVK
jgi:hypothetical protein